jgi:hypothetical protein
VFRCPVIAGILALFALATLALAVALLRAMGPGFRIGRLLSASPAVAIAEAIQLAASGRPHYVRVSGRISSDEEFPDEHDRPLVYRRSRIEIAGRSSGWQVLSQDVETVPFGIELRGDFLAVDAAALAEGLVVVPREALGSARDLGDELAPGHDPATPSRLVIEQVSAVEHATVAGVPVATAEGGAQITAGLGRPLILTTVELPAAMRLLARGRRRQALAATLLLGCAAVLGLAALVALIGGWP